MRASPLIAGVVASIVVASIVVASIVVLTQATACAGPRSAPALPVRAPVTVAPPAAAPPAALHWDLVVEAGPILDQRICRADGATLGPGEVAPVDVRAHEVADVVGDGPCVRVRVDLGAAADRFRERAAAARADDDVVIASPDVWLWTTRTPTGGTLVVRDGGPRARAAVPFPTADAADTPAGAAAFHVDAGTWRFLSASIFGAITVRRLAVAGAQLDVVTLPGERHMVDADVDRWLGGAAAAVATGAGATRRFPFERALVIVEPTLGSGVPFGMVSRGGGPQALLLLGERARVDDVVDDWVAVHELSHLLHPLIALEDAWFGEGLASYHQNILRARAGLLDDDEAWALLRDGFERGAAAAERGPWTLSLRDASARMRAEGRWLQTYWGGAAVVLWLDVALRRCHGGSVDDLVASFRAEQPRVDERRIPAKAIVARAAGLAPACAHIADDVAAMLDEPFPKAGLLTLDALSPARGPADPLRQAIIAGDPRSGAGAAGGQLSAP